MALISTSAADTLSMPFVTIVEGFERTDLYPGTQMPSDLPRIVVKLQYQDGREETITVDESWATVWGPAASVSQRWPYFEGNLLWMMYLRHYIKEEYTQPLYPNDVLEKLSEMSVDEKRKWRLFLRSKRNNRNENNSREEYKVSIQKEGLNMQGRSRACSVEVLLGWHAQVAESIAGAHIVEGAYEAEEEQPQNAYCVATIQRGVPGVYKFKHQTPTDIQDNVVQNQNKYGKSSGFNPEQMIDHVQGLSKDWVVYPAFNINSISLVRGSGNPRSS